MLYLLVFVCSFFSWYSSITNTTVIQISIIICCFIAITSNTIIYFTVIDSCSCKSFFVLPLVHQFSLQNLHKLCKIFSDRYGLCYRGCRDIVLYTLSPSTALPFFKFLSIQSLYPHSVLRVNTFLCMGITQCINSWLPSFDDRYSSNSRRV